MHYNNNFYACIEIFNISIIKNNITSLRVRNYISNCQTVNSPNDSQSTSRKRGNNHFETFDYRYNMPFLEMELALFFFYTRLRLRSENYFL